MAMRKIILLLFLISLCIRYFSTTGKATPSIHDENNIFSLTTSNTWKDYTIHIPQLNMNKEQWTWAYSLTFKSKHPVKLTTLVLKWVGEKIDQMSASLYQKKERDSAVIPIQKNFICDGMWEPKTQQLIFTPQEKIVAVNKYYLMLSYPKELEKKVKKGRFIVSTTEVFDLTQQTPLVALHQ
jgi:hypothetical protein